MNHFPAVDPIPLPAPIWLMKALHIVTLALHFIAVEILLGSLLVAALLSVARSSAVARAVTAAIAKRLPVVMTYVINLGVPPLLFAQVLYGRALYTSSVLIGAWWIGVIGLPMATYWLLYRFAARVENGRTAWWVGLLAWALPGTVARVLTSNMTLMLAGGMAAHVPGICYRSEPAGGTSHHFYALAVHDGRRHSVCGIVADLAGRPRDGRGK